MLLIGIILLLISGVSWILSGIIMGVAPKKGISIPQLLTVNYALGLIVSLVVVCFSGIGNASWKSNAIMFILLFCCGIVNSRQLSFMSLAMQTGPNGIVWSVLQCGFIIPYTVGILFFRVPLTCWGLCAIIALIASLLILGVSKDRNNANKMLSSSWKKYTLGAFLCTGMTQLLCNIPSYYENLQQVNSVARSIAVYTGFVFAFPMTSFLEGKWKNFSSLLLNHIKRPYVWTMCILWQTCSLVVGYFINYRALDIMANNHAGAMSYPIMVGASIFCFQLYGIFVLKEKLSLSQIFGLILCLYGIATICL